ncbi:hypothetical protein G7K_0055-t1 [Saitoella complicata NRRL Y-17804]|uniref:DUF1264 domain-containing protein n=2 Tax=Saitoella complicata (strain BCRC 22490 / CBS 7301 / JCM 7358 / NBRC 10748 / NRRL Y-17804) TaxID=698492 RepID=A0A0E9N7J4_SAICN|nr:hypothetical protein G7K_0055-t1 [Saitoella complicata NRRL Y-17804]
MACFIPTSCTITKAIHPFPLPPSPPITPVTSLLSEIDSASNKRSCSIIRNDGIFEPREGDMKTKYGSMSALMREVIAIQELRNERIKVHRGIGRLIKDYKNEFEKKIVEIKDNPGDVCASNTESLTTQRAKVQDGFRNALNARKEHLHALSTTLNSVKATLAGVKARNADLRAKIREEYFDSTTSGTSRPSSFTQCCSPLTLLMSTPQQMPNIEACIAADKPEYTEVVTPTPGIMIEPTSPTTRKLTRPAKGSLEEFLLLEKVLCGAPTRNIDADAGTAETQELESERINPVSEEERRVVREMWEEGIVSVAWPGDCNAHHQLAIATPIVPINTTEMTSCHEPTVPGEPRSWTSIALDTAASMTQSFHPLKNICAHLNGLHVYSDDPTRHVETTHYCSHHTEDMRQCILYDGPGPNARLIGVEYMITEKLFKDLPPEEKKYWHSHVYEAKSGMLIMPKPATMPGPIWDAAELQEMEQVVHLYGKTIHLWQVDRGDTLPLGEPKLMMSFTSPTQLPTAALQDRDERYSTDYLKKRELRKDLPEPETDELADGWVKGRGIRFEGVEVPVKGSPAVSDRLGGEPEQAADKRYIFLSLTPQSNCNRPQSISCKRTTKPTKHKRGKNELSGSENEEKEKNNLIRVPINGYHATETTEHTNKPDRVSSNTQTHNERVSLITPILLFPSSP